MPVTLKNVLKEIVTNVIKDAKYDSKDLTLSLPYPWSKRHSLSLLYADLISESNEVIFNLNYAIQRISLLPRDKSISRAEKSRLLRLFVRMYTYEFARTEDVFNHFLLGLSMLGELTKPLRRKITKVFHDEFKPMIDGRNRLIHRKLDLPKDEAILSCLSAGEIFGRKKWNSKDYFTQYDVGLLKLTQQRAIAMRYNGRTITNFIQMVVDTSSMIFTDGIFAK